ncbi:CYP4F2, partial [Acrasis kona]
AILAFLLAIPPTLLFIAILLVTAKHTIVLLRLFRKSKTLPLLPLNYGIGQIGDAISRRDMFHRLLKYSRMKNLTDSTYVTTMFMYPMVTTSNPEYIKQILITGAQNFSKSSNTNENLTLFFGRGLVTSAGDLWKKQRSILNQFFAPSVVDNLMDKMVYQIKNTLKVWNKGTGTFTMKNIQADISELTLRIVVGCVFGSDDSTVSDIVTNYNSLCYVFMPILIQASLSHSLLHVPIPVNKRYQKMKHNLNAYVNELITRKKKELTPDTLSCNSSKLDLMSMMLMSSRDVEGNVLMTEQQISDECKTFLAAGHETTSSLISWVLYHLCIHDKVQDRVIDEIDQLSSQLESSQVPSYDQINSLSYMRSVMDESMRLFPPIMCLDKETVKDVRLGNHLIPKGTQVSIDFVGLHRNEKIWKNADVFDPDRWQEERLRKEVPNYRNCFLPFSSGQRNCIGKIFTYTEAPLILYMILKEYRVSFADGFDSSRALFFETGAALRPEALDITLTRREGI